MPTKLIEDTRTFTVLYSAGKEVQVKRLPPKQLGEIAILSQAIFEKFYEVYNYSRNCLGDVLGDPSCWGYIEQLAALLPVVGQTEPGIDLDLLGGDYEQIGRIFITKSINPETGEIELPSEGGTILPSEIAALHGQHFFRVRAVETVEEKDRIKKLPVAATP